MFVKKNHTFLCWCGVLLCCCVVDKNLSLICNIFTTTLDADEVRHLAEEVKSGKSKQKTVDKYADEYIGLT